MSLLSRLAVQAARAYGVLSAVDKTKVSADYLVVAGGGSGGQSVGFSEASGGGGAGGYRTSTTTLSTLTTYTVTVGAGGAAVTTYGTLNKGSDSVFNSITSTGGGGGQADGAGQAGGSGGGGGGGTSSRGGGAGNTPSTSPSQGNDGGTGFGSATTSQRAGGGGGGASAVGANATASTGGAGGAGSASSISGSSVTYAGGGGGHSLTTGGAGGSGGGGAGGSGSGASGTNGTANRGGGGGGANGGSSGAGGSGIVIISYTSATPKFVGGTITTSGGKQIHTFTSSGTLSPITPITASYLVVSGGGGGGSSNGASAGGAGAGGLRTSSTTLYSGATYIVTVGAGGAGGASGANNQGSLGNSSSLAGTGLTTVTSTGGGGGGAGAAGAGQNGGSGGGGGTNAGTGGSGTSGEGFAGGIAETGGNFRSGGGGGASAVGAAGTSGGTGGAGTASSITGSSITYAGGGGGGAFTGASGAGGAGGGGAGGTSSFTNGVSGTSGLGGGGGGTQIGTGGNGGSGTVIISYAGSQAFNGGLVTTSGGNTIHTFTSTGALTPLTNNLTNSLRFRSSASASLSRTPTIVGNRQKWTWSGWVKRGTFGAGGILFSGGTLASTTYDTLFFNAESVAFNSAIGGIGKITSLTSAVFRDPSAWYHIVYSIDTTQATNANGVKIYVNGNQQTVTFTVYTQNTNTSINNTVSQDIGRLSGYASEFFDGYMTDINFIDGQALEPYYFGNNDANGVWKPIAYKGTYGTNGFYLTFGNTTSTTTLGYDSSPNGNNWTTNNISLTAGTTYDAMTDVPTNTSATVANYCTLNPLNTGLAPIWGNLVLNQLSAAWVASGSTMLQKTGKWYFEGFMGTIGSGNYIGIGLKIAGAVGVEYVGQVANSWGIITNSANLSTYTGNVSTNATIITATTAMAFQVAVDFDAGKMWFGYNNTWIGGGSPSAGTSPTYTFTANTELQPILSAFTNTNYINFGQRAFSYTPPTNFLAWNTFNLPTPTILQGNKYFDSTLYTGQGVVQTVVNAGQFKPDFVWIKSRSNITNHTVYDSVRGFNASPGSPALFTNLTDAEGSSTNTVSSANSNGFTIAGSSNNLNTNAYTFVGWQWQAGQGSTSSNTSGTVTSTVSVSTTAGFSVATFTATSGSYTVGHGLGVAPKMTIVKRRDSSSGGNWWTWHIGLGDNTSDYLALNLTSAEGSITNMWGTVGRTSTVCGFNGTASTVAGGTFVMYNWAEIAGFSKFGSYTGNGSADGVFVYTGFRPKFILYKNSSFAGTGWAMLDSSRNTYNVLNARLFSDSSSAEDTSVSPMDFTSNGFKVRSTNDGVNRNGDTIIYMAFAENPFKNANAR